MTRILARPLSASATPARPGKGQMREVADAATGDDVPCRRLAGLLIRRGHASLKRISNRNLSKGEERRLGLGSSDVTKLVAAGYDQIADSYLQQFGQSAVRPRKLNELADLLPSRAHVLDLGCGAGVPVARDLIARGFEVTGVDASARQIERARGNVPQARFILADMTTIEFPAFDFDAVAAFYSITHIPRDRHASLLAHLSFEAVIFGNHIAEPPHRLGSDFDLGVRTIECGE